MERLDRCIKGKNEEVVCSCRGSIKDIMECLSTVTSLREVSRSGRHQEETGLYSNHRESMRKMMKIQRGCAIKGLSILNNKCQLTLQAS